MRIYLLLVLLFSYFSCVSAQGTDTIGSSRGTVNAVQAFQRYQKNADEYFQGNDYQHATELYTQLARIGDKFSQYRLAYLYANGLGVEKNLVEAYAWAYVAQESKKTEFVEYQASLAENLAVNELAAGKVKASQYLESYGLHASASNAHQLIRRLKGECAGSRIGATCDRISSSGVTCNAYTNSIPTRRCLIMGSVGLPGVTGITPLDIRIVENNLREIMRTYSPGYIELHELRVIED